MRHDAKAPSRMTLNNGTLQRTGHIVAGNEEEKRNSGYTS
jgi:hypothetical protein